MVEKVEIGYNRQENELKACRQVEANLESQLRDITEKLEEMENNKRNNLIFYGIPNDPYESHASLHQKVRGGFIESVSAKVLTWSQKGEGGLYSRDFYDLWKTHLTFSEANQLNKSYKCQRKV